MMLKALREIVLNTHEENAFFGDKLSRMLRAKLDALAPDAPIATIAQLKTDLGKAELKLGNELETIRLLRQCERDYLPKIVAGWPKKDAFNLINSLRFNIGIAYMRQAEKNNCCQRNTPESCIMPIQSEGIHTGSTFSFCGELGLARKGATPIHSFATTEFLASRNLPILLTKVV